ncbi:MAG: hypothetical protein K1X68_12870 [Saprospiraceae bacterium]|nr:hypothetical protein [Saprospiraceae bacterium]HMW39524.1 hypothetical protein [Saprospiraceae bacterium]HMX89462.1 hypothetical protein [Saprospiraceae bacterium]HMZ41302.1 hypothetical protein [Saprospiraceae bacterium]HNA65080.1 hypothetical protein [Saprospiraceae bacterium]
MTRISSAATLFFAVFLPVFWLVFFGSLTAGLFLVNIEDLDGTFFQFMRWIFLALFVLFAILIYRTILKLRRIDADEQYIYVSNYLRTIRIPYTQIDSLQSKSLSIRLLGKINLSHKGYFGSSITFICDEQKYLLLEEKINRLSVQNDY